MSQLQVRPLAEGLPFGVRIGGVTREGLADAAVRREIDDLFVQHGMIVFENGESSNEMQVALSGCFGPLKDHPVKTVTRVDQDAMPGVVVIRSPANSGGVVDLAGRQLSHWMPWHFDHCYNDELNRCGVLRAVDIVEEGGITGFTDGIALYNRFPKDLLARIEGKEIVYRLESQYDEDKFRFGRPDDLRVIRRKPLDAEFEKIAAAMPRAIHPAVWTRPTGEKCLHISPYMAVGILGMENAEGDALLEAVCQEINRLSRDCSYNHKWQPTDMLVWDNLRMLHAVSGNRPEDERTMYRTTISGDYGLGRWEAARTFESA